MSKPFSLQALHNLSKKQNETAINNLGILNQQQRASLSKLEMLQQFRRDYQGKFQEAERNGMALTDLRNFQDFIYRLDMAIKQQQGVVDLMTNSLNSGRAALSETQRKLQSFDMLAQRHFQAEQALEAKAEQKLQDEHAGRFASYRVAENNDELEGANHE